MPSLSASQRRFLIESLSSWLREKIGDEANEVDFEMSAGVEAQFGDDLMQPQLAQNGTATLTVRINGGARHTQALADGSS